MKKFNKNFNSKAGIEESKKFVQKVKSSYFVKSKELKDIKAKLYTVVVDDGNIVNDEEISNKIPKFPEKISKLDIKGLENGKFYHFWLSLTENSLGEDMSIPVIIAKGVHEGKQVKKLKFKVLFSELQLHFMEMKLMELL
jgi:hypothetical protein